MCCFSVSNRHCRAERNLFLLHGVLSQHGVGMQSLEMIRGLSYAIAPLSPHSHYIYIYFYLSIYLSIYLRVYLFIYLFVDLCLSICLFMLCYFIPWPPKCMILYRVSARSHDAKYSSAEPNSVKILHGFQLPKTKASHSHCTN